MAAFVCTYGARGIRSIGRADGYRGLRYAVHCFGHQGKGESMNTEDIIRMAREACDEASDVRGRLCFEFDTYGIEKFAALVAAAEREECAKEISAEINDEIEDEAYCILVALLARIRARGQE